MSPSWLQPVFVAPRFHGMGVHNLQSQTFRDFAPSFTSDFQDNDLDQKIQESIKSLGANSSKNRDAAHESLRQKLLNKNTREAYKRVMSQPENWSLKDGTAEQALRLQSLERELRRQEELAPVLDELSKDPFGIKDKLLKKGEAALESAKKGMSEPGKSFEAALSEYAKHATGVAKEVAESALLGYRSDRLTKFLRGGANATLQDRLKSFEDNATLQTELERLSKFPETPDAVKKMLDAARDTVKSLNDYEGQELANKTEEVARMLRKTRKALEESGYPPADNETIDQWKQRHEQIDKDMEKLQKDLDKYNKEEQNKKKEEEEKQEMGRHRSEPRMATRIVHHVPATASMAPTPPSPSSYVGDLISLGLRLGTSGSSVRPPVATLGGSGGGSVTAATSVTT